MLLYSYTKQTQSQEKQKIDKEINSLKKSNIDIPKEIKNYETDKLSTELKREESKLKLEN